MIVDEQLQPTQDLNVRSTVPLIAPRLLREETQVSLSANRTVVESRETIKKILSGEDPRMFAVVGPCSIHDPKGALEYACAVTEPGRAGAGPAGFGHAGVFREAADDPGLEGADQRSEFGRDLRYCRRFAAGAADFAGDQRHGASGGDRNAGADYAAIYCRPDYAGFNRYRTTESPTHRQMASGLSMPVGYKNGTDGGLQVAIDAMFAARSPHSFLGIDGEGNTCVINTKGNLCGHLILRGGRSGPNYSAKFTQEGAAKLKQTGLSPNLVVDCSHANSNKDYRLQSIPWKDVIGQRVDGNSTIVGLMLESNLFPDTQKLTGDKADLQYGVSITDGCIGWEETESLILDAHRRLADAGI